MEVTGADFFILLCGTVGLVFAWIQWKKLQETKVEDPDKSRSTERSNFNSGAELTGEQKKQLYVCFDAIKEGAKSFLSAEYKICAYFVAAMSCVIFILVCWGGSFKSGFFTTLAFIVGAVTSMISGYIGMMVAVEGNARVTLGAVEGGGTNEAKSYKPAFARAFCAGSAMGFALCSLGILVLWVILFVYKASFDAEDYDLMMDCISGYGLGGSSIAMFGRIGGGIYTKAADVGADLVGKVINDLPEDSPMNPGTIADNVGDNVGDVAGMSSDLFGSFAESTCAALVIAATSADMREAGWGALLFPVTVSAAGLIICLIVHFNTIFVVPGAACIVNCVATAVASFAVCWNSTVGALLPGWAFEPDVSDMRGFGPVTAKEKADGNDAESALKAQLILTTLGMIPTAYILSYTFLPASFTLNGVAQASFSSDPYSAFVCISFGCIGGLIIGLVTEYFTSFSYKPVREVAFSVTDGGAATNVIFGLALGYESAVIPVAVLSIIILVNFSLMDTYGVALGAIGMLSTLATGLTIDGYGPVSDNAGGIAEMAELDDYVRDCTDALDAAGNTTAAIGKGFAIGSAALVSLALYGAFVVRLGVEGGVNVLKPLTFAFLLIGSMLPYWFSAMTMKAVGVAAMKMVNEIVRQFADGKIMAGEKAPDHDKCIKVSTTESLRMMVAPSALVIAAPLLAGTFFGVYAVFGLLTGGLVSGVQLAISMSNTGGAWDNAKKYIENKKAKKEDQEGVKPFLAQEDKYKNGQQVDYDAWEKLAWGKKTPDGESSECHKAAVIGDTVGDPLKDTSGPALNILMKLMAILSLVFAEYFLAINDGRGIFNIDI